MTQVATLHAPLSLREHEAIGRNRLLAALPPGDFALLAPHLIETVLDKGTVLQEPGQTIRRVYFPHSGLASIMGVMPEGASIEAAAVGREGGIGLTTGLGSTLAVSRAVVQLQMRAAYLPTATFAEVTERSAAIRAMIVRPGATATATVTVAHLPSSGRRSGKRWRTRIRRLPSWPR